jgi:hypothetical protein
VIASSPTIQRLWAGDGPAASQWSDRCLHRDNRHLEFSWPITDGIYAFPVDFTLTGGVRYWFYGDAQGSFVSSFDTDIYSGGDLYTTGIASLPFRKVPASSRMVGGRFVPAPVGVFTDANFKLQGSPK